MSSRFCVILVIVNIFGNVSTLEELPQVEDNNILKTDAAIRETTNKLFSILKFKINKERPVPKQYSFIHNYLVSTSLHDYTNLIEIAKLTRVDKTKLNNETRNFIAIVNEILDEDVKHDVETEDEYIIRHIEGFLTNLDKYTDTYEYTQNNVDFILAEILKLLEKNETFSEAYHNTTFNEDNDGSWLELSDENDTVIDDSEFWRPDARRIFEGKKVDIRFFPFMASIQIFNHFQCAGSIIKPDLILTAASCLQLAWNNRFFRENPAFLSARVGSTFHNAGGEKIEVTEVYFHPSYDPRSLINNLCIIRLWRYMRNSRRTKRIEIDRHAHSLPLTTDGITIVGWGARRQGNIITDPFMAKAVLDIYPVDECQDIYSKQYVTQRHFCAGFLSKGGGACNRDIGGPGIVHSVLTGVVSFGSPVCGTPNAPTVFTKLGFYTDWIDTIMEQKVPHKKQRTTTLGPKSFHVPTYIPSKTTFKITPLVVTKRKRKRIVVEDVDTLRQLRDEGLLKTFVDTVIGSEEAEKLLREANITDIKLHDSLLGKTTQVERIPFTYSAVTTLEPYAPSTAMGFIAQDEKSSESKVRHDKQIEPEEELSLSYESFEKQETITKATPEESFILDADTRLSHKLEEDIVKLIDEINLEDFIKERKDAAPVEQKKIEKHNSNKKDKVATLLYLSDNSEKDSASIADENRDLGDVSIESGLDIPADTFNDLTYRNNVSDNFFISKQELLRIVSEALKEELSKSSMNISTTTETGATKSTVRTTTKMSSPANISPAELTTTQMQSEEESTRKHKDRNRPHEVLLRQDKYY